MQIMPCNCAQYWTILDFSHFFTHTVHTITPFDEPYLSSYSNTDETFLGDKEISMAETHYCPNATVVVSCIQKSHFHDNT